MKLFTTVKIGYTAGIYGCSNEYFTTIIITDVGIKSLCFYGMYGAEERINRTLKDLGYEEKYTPSYYGKMTRRDVSKYILSEYSAIEEIKKIA